MVACVLGGGGGRVTQPVAAQLASWHQQAVLAPVAFGSGTRVHLGLPGQGRCKGTHLGAARPATRGVARTRSGSAATSWQARLRSR